MVFPRQIIYKCLIQGLVLHIYVTLPQGKYTIIYIYIYITHIIIVTLRHNYHFNYQHLPTIISSKGFQLSIKLSEISSNYK